VVMRTVTRRPSYCTSYKCHHTITMNTTYLLLSLYIYYIVYSIGQVHTLGVEMRFMIYRGVYRSVGQCVF